MRTLTLLVIILTVLWLSACGPSRTIPKGVPYPKTLRPGIRVYPMNQLRCLGGGIGGCGWGERRPDGPGAR